MPHNDPSPLLLDYQIGQRAENTTILILDLISTSTGGTGFQRESITPPGSLELLFLRHSQPGIIISATFVIMVAPSWCRATHNIFLKRN
jgi:hypothetical protein